MSAPIPPMDPRPLGTMVEMGMGQDPDTCSLPEAQSSGREWPNARGFEQLSLADPVRQSMYNRSARYEERQRRRAPVPVRTDSGSYSGDSANLHHEVRQRQALYLNCRGGRE
jgi:hypothetical protein